MISLLVFLSLMAAGAQGGEAVGHAASDSIFRFQSRSWPNLHHFAYKQALLTADPPRTRGSTGEIASADGLSVVEAAAWRLTVDFYGDSLIERDLLFDDDLIALDHILGGLPDDADEDALLEAGVPVSLASILADAAPAYPYAIGQALWFRGEERRAEYEALSEHWQAYLDGEADFESAIDAIIQALQ